MDTILSIKRGLPVTAALATAAAAGQRWLSTFIVPRAAATLDVAGASAASPPLTCPECHTEIDASIDLFRQFALCPACGHHFAWSAQARIDSLCDPGTFRPIGQALLPVDFLGFVDDLTYAARLTLEQRKAGLSDAALIGRCRIGGVEAVLAALDFRFMGGSMGSVVGERITVAFEYALSHRLPVVTVVNSGGARMQEGTISLMQMPKTAAAAQRFHAAGLFYCSVLASPTTGGVFASFASLGDVILAEPHAIIGFAGPRVAEQALGQRLPAGSHRAEALLEAGQLDGIVARQELPQVVGALLRATVAPPRERHARHPHTPQRRWEEAVEQRHSAWDSVLLARHPDRPSALDYILFLSPTFLELHGDRCYGDDPAIVTGLGAIDGRPVMFIGEQRRFEMRDGQRVALRPKPEGFRKAMRMMEIANHLRCPIITFIDTIGADPGAESERHGIAWSLAHCLATMSDAPIPIITAIIGEGASGGAVVLAYADHIVMLQNAIFEVIAPEGAATILYRDAGRAEQVASQLRLTARDCLALGIADAIIPEPPEGVHTDPAPTMRALQQMIADALADLEQFPTRRLLARRYRKFRALGRFRAYHQRALPNPATTIRRFLAPPR
ncbi:MAG: acetyl-CoA carboxylase carboxyl transferase subunit beta [Chloroflexota bacterium]|nr:acetyl-CoA carboxylase carboxyl transferase subunit beta [Chloroflexota bacterium]